MNPTSLIPTPDTIPAPAWLFLALDIVTFLIHILIINVVVGGSLILFFSQLSKPNSPATEAMHDALTAKLPSLFALGITFGVAPLLFVQVIYGHLIYSSSVLMAVYWILIIPFLILAYYGAYIHAKNYSLRRSLAITAIGVTSLLLLYISFIYVNNMTLMVQPEHWGDYFANRNGTLLNLGDPTLAPRYLHFLTASIAVAALFMAGVWHFRDVIATGENVKLYLRIFAVATSAQVLVGIWFLLAIPSDFIKAFMGGNLFYSLVLLVAFLMTLSAIYTAFRGKFMVTAIHLIVIALLMVINRVNLRSLYLQDIFSMDDLKVAPQYSVMALFFAIFIIGLALVAYMLKLAQRSEERSLNS
ncbi:MAG: hypothetical protein ACOY90_12270 [Candidatus Zhuqueibacterota bacterium]